MRIILSIELLPVNPGGKQLLGKEYLKLVKAYSIIRSNRHMNLKNGENMRKF